MGTRIVTGTLKHLDGTPIVSGELKFTLVKEFQTATETFPRDRHTIVTDVNGNFSITLGVPDTGTAKYNVEIPESKVYTFYLEAGAPITLESLLLIAASSEDQNILQTLIDANNVVKITNVTNTYTILETDLWIRCDGTFNVTLPLATGSGKCFGIINIGSGVITVLPNGIDTINGFASYNLDSIDSLVVIDVENGLWDGR